MFEGVGNFDFKIFNDFLSNKIVQIKWKLLLIFTIKKNRNT